MNKPRTFGDLLAVNKKALSDFEKLAQGMKQLKTDRQWVDGWLASVGCTDEVERAEVMQACKDDSEARAYYVARAKGEL